MLMTLTNPAIAGRNNHQRLVEFHTTPSTMSSSSSSSSTTSTSTTSKPSTLTNSGAEDTNETSSIAATVATTETTATTNHSTTDRSRDDNNNSNNSSNSNNRIQSSSRTTTNTNNNKSNNNKYGSVEDLQMYALGMQNTRLATDLSQARHDWDTLQHSYRANTHARFVYQTTLARIVAHVQDFSDDKVLIEDILRWDGECEHLEEEHDDDEEEGLQGQERIQGLHGSIRSLGSNGSGGDLHAYNSTTPNSPVQAVKQSRYHNGPIIIDWNDVETTVSSEFESPSSLLGLPYSYCRSHHESLNEQNNCMKCEIEKWKASMARIRACNQNEVNELLKHQRTLSKVVERIKASSFRSTEKVVKWYEECQEEAKRCGSFSEKDAEDLIAGDQRRSSGDLDHEATQQKKAECDDETPKTDTDDSGQAQDEEKQENVVEDVHVQKTNEKVLNTSRIGPDGFDTFDGKEHEEDTTVRTMSSSMDDTACPVDPPTEGLMSSSISSSFPPSQLKENKTMQTTSSQSFVPQPSSAVSPPVTTRVQTTCGCIIM